MTKTLLWITLMICLIPNAQAREYTDTQIINAIYKVEGKAEATYLYGIRSVSYDSPKEARQICLNTVRNHRKRHLSHDDGLSYLECLSLRYAPIGSNTDNGTNQYWLKNIRYFLNKESL